MRTVVFRLAIVVIVLLGIGAIWYVDDQRNQERSVLSGFFECQPTDVSSRAGGRIEQILVTEGDEVHKGQLLLQIEAAPDQSDLAAKSAAANLAAEQLQELVNGPRPQDIAKQRAAVLEDQEELASLRDGPRPQEIAQALAAKNSARERYAEALRGPTTQVRQSTLAKYQSGVAAETLAAQEAARYTSLYQLGAVTKQQLDQTAAALTEAQANSKDLREDWVRAQLGTPADELEEAHQSFMQAKAAYDLVLAGSRQEDIAASAAKLQQAQEQLNELTAGSRPEDIIIARYTLQQAKALTESEALNVAERRVCAPFDGVVDNVPVSIGDLVNADVPLIRLDDPNDIWVRFYVPEFELSHVVVGGDATLRVDGIVGDLPAYVESIADSGEFTPANLQSPDERGKQVFAVRIRLKKPDPQVKAGMDVTAVRIGTWSP